MIRSPLGSTIISYHPDPEWRTTSAKVLHSRIKLAGDSVYWQNIFRKASDPTFILLTILWHCLYTWDQALEELYKHISWLVRLPAMLADSIVLNMHQESKIIRTNDMNFSTKLHVIRAYLLHYESLLVDFEKSVLFIRDTPNPAAAAGIHPLEEQKTEKNLLDKECKNLLDEIERLERSRDMQNKRLKNAVNLVREALIY